MLCWVWLVALLGLTLARPTSDSTWPEALSVGVGLLLLLSCLIGAVATSTIASWCRGWLVAYMVTGGIAVWEIVTGNHLSNYFIYYDANLPSWTPTNAPASTLGNPNNYAFFLFASLIILSIGRALAASRLAKLSYLIPLLTIPVFLYFTESRTSLALWAVCVVVYVVAQKRVALIALGTLALIIAIASNGGIFRMVTEWFGNFIGGESGIVRVNLALNGLDFLFETYLLGLGPGGFESRMSQGAEHPTGGVLSAHNGAVEVVAQYGVVVFAVLITLLLLLAITGVRTFRATESGSAERQIAGALILGVVTMPPIVVTNSSTLTQSFPWVYFAFLTMIGIYISQTGAGTPQQEGNLMSAALEF